MFDSKSPCHVSVTAVQRDHVLAVKRNLLLGAHEDMLLSELQVCSQGGPGPPRVQL